ncbi:hypothetical protein AK830_g4516 [Neonectria ditissima]|uniref:Uncharacterized protein n=1 Tax=Neonectria ditissima TaxID=78410 RepID=A0A0P7B695_9HYPO|nr:hypothetical protein AK830_g4516 [Neonectria ditissima]
MQSIDQLLASAFAAPSGKRRGGDPPKKPEGNPGKKARHDVRCYHCHKLGQNMAMPQAEEVSGRVGQVEGRLDRLEGRLDRFEGRLDRLEGVVQELVAWTRNFDAAAAAAVAAEADAEAAAAEAAATAAEARAAAAAATGNED